MSFNPSRAAKNVTLSERREFLVRVSCGRCRPIRYYCVDDLIEVFGDLKVIGMEHHMRCECGYERVSARLTLPSARERAEITVRKLVRIEMIKRPVWRDE